MSDRPRLASGRALLDPATYGMQLESGHLPEGVLAETEFQYKATPEKIAAAREFGLTEARLDDFEPYGSTGRRLRHIETGQVFTIAGDQPLMQRDQRTSKTGIEFFIVDGWRILFLRPRGWSNQELGPPHELLEGRVEPGPGRTIRLVHPKTGRVVREDLKL